MRSTLNTKRLILRPFEVCDLDSLARLAADPEVMSFIGEGLETRAKVSEGLDRAIRRWREDGMSWWVVLDRNTQMFIGRCCLQRLRDLPNEIEVGYAFERACWGKGFAREAVDTALTYGFDTLGLQSIVALTHPDNFRSQRFLGRLGFDHEKRISFHGKKVELYRQSAAARRITGSWSKR